MSPRRARFPSNRQLAIINFIREHQAERHFPPTVREIGNAVGISSTSVVDYHLKAIERAGRIRRTADISRGIELIEEGPEYTPARPVPIVGRIAAGSPIEAISSQTETIQLPFDLGGEGAYALEVHGKSMIEDLIDEGDLVIIKPQPTANDGDIVVALIQESDGGGGEATLKRLYREANRIRLQPANPKYEPIYVTDVDIQGVVIGVIRRY